MDKVLNAQVKAQSISLIMLTMRPIIANNANHFQMIRETFKSIFCRFITGFQLHGSDRLVRLKAEDKHQVYIKYAKRNESPHKW